MGAKRENLGSVLEWKMRETEKGDLGMGGWGEEGVEGGFPII